jgi:hypothetical protein
MINIPIEDKDTDKNTNAKCVQIIRFKQQRGKELDEECKKRTMRKHFNVLSAYKLDT